MRKSKVWAVIAAALLLVLSIALMGACGKKTSARLTVTSIEKTGTDGMIDTYTMTFSDGSQTQFTVTNGTDGANGADGKSAYMLYIQYHPDYAGDEAMWLDDLAKGKIDRDYIENAQCLITVKVTDTDGNSIRSALVEADGYGYTTGADGTCRLLTSGKKAVSLTVARYGYATAHKTLTAAELADAGKALSVTVALEKTVGADGYATRNDKYLSFAVPCEENTAYSYWYFTYGETGLQLTVDVIDDEIFAASSVTGMNDNIEFVMQKATDTAGYSEGDSLNVMVELGSEGVWARRATSNTVLGTDVYASLATNGQLSVVRKAKTAAIDGWNGCTVEVFLDYALWELTADRARGNLSILTSARNGDRYGNSVWRFHVGLGSIWQKAGTAAVIEADGTPRGRQYACVDLEKALADSRVYAENKTLAANMAQLESNGVLVRQFIDGAQLFTDRNYVVDGNAVPTALTGKSFLRAGIGETCDFTIREAGYVVVTALDADRNSAAVFAYLQENGFARIAQRQPVFGYNTATATKEYMNSGNALYYAKRCASGERYSIPAWSIVLFAEQATYDGDTWMTTAAEATVVTADNRERYAPTTRTWQGIPGIETLPKESGGTRLWMSWFTGGEKEPSVGNYAVFYYSDNGGADWTQAIVVAMPDGNTDSRVYDPGLFVDDRNTLWLWWNQTNYRFGESSVWYAKVENAADGTPETLTVSTPVCTSTGLKLNKPIKLSDGEWLYAAHDIVDNTYTKVYASADRGQTWRFKGKAFVQNGSTFHEPVIAETRDRDGNPMLTMWNRCSYSYNVAVSYSYDGGATWTDGTEGAFKGPSSRVNALTLPNGNLLYAHHYKTESRRQLYVSLSTDGGMTFPHNLVLDMREGTSYPDVCTDGNGNIYVVWDFNRYADQQIYMAVLTEAELCAIDGVAVLDASRRKVVSSLTLSGMQADIAGRVTDGDGNGIENATVTAISPYGGTQSTTTDAFGAYRFVRIDAEAYRLVVTCDGYDAAETTLAADWFIDGDFRITVAPIVLSAQANTTYDGTVTDRITGLGISGATVSVGGVETTTDADGAFRLQAASTATELVVSADGYIGQRMSTGETRVTLLPENTVELGRVGGGKTGGAVDVIAFERIYLTVGAEKLTVTAFADREAVAAGTDAIILSLNGSTYTSGRSAHTLLIETYSSGLIRVKYCPGGTVTNIASGTGTAGGVTVDIDKTRFSIEVSYTAFSQCGYPASYQWGVAPFGLAVTAGTKVGSAWTYTEWQYADIPDCLAAGAVVRAQTDTYVIVADGKLAPYAAYYGVWTVGAFDDYFATTTEQVAEKTFSAHMGAFDVTSDDVGLRTVRDGETMFSDRTAHVWNGKQMQLLNGMSTLYKSVGAAASLPVSKAGYLLMLVPSDRTVDASWGKALLTVPNPGYKIAATTVGCYVHYFEIGETVTVPTDGLLCTNAMETDILVFGDSYTDSARFWLTWDADMRPFGAKTIGISGSRIDTPTGGDALGWTARALQGEIAAYRPKKILIHLGVNDIDNGVLGTDAAAQAVRLLQILRAQLPDTEIYYTLIHPNVMFYQYATQYEVFNAKLSKFVETDPNCRIIDFRDRLYVRQGGLLVLNESLYRDRLHLSDAGYAIWTEKIYAAMGIATA